MSLPLDPLQTFDGYGPAEAGLGRFFSKVYAVLAGGLALAGGIAWSVAHVPPLRAVFFTATPDGYAFTAAGLALAVAPLIVLLIAGFNRRALSASGAGLVYWTTTALFGGSLAILALTYAATDLASTFAVTAGAFAMLSLAGLGTRRSLGGLRAFLTMALFGLILAIAVNLIFNNPVAALVLDVAGVLIFAGLIAADTQELRRIYASTDDPDALGAAINYGALTLFLNMLNLFQLLLALRGPRLRR